MALNGTIEFSPRIKREFMNSLKLTNDKFFSVVMNDNSTFEYVARILLDIPDLIINKVVVQNEIKNLVGHSVRMDAFGEDSKGKLYNIEMQVNDNDNHIKRVRYYQAAADFSTFEEGQKYKELPELYLVYITSFDMFKLNKTKYEVKRVLYEDPNFEVPNGVHEIYLNLEVDDNTPKSKLLQYFKTSDNNNTEFGPLSNRVNYFKTYEGVEYSMSEELKKIIQEEFESYISDEKAQSKNEGKLEGRLEGRLEGKDEGIKEANEQWLKILKANGMDTDQINTMIDKYNSSKTTTPDAEDTSEF